MKKILALIVLSVMATSLMFATGRQSTIPTGIAGIATTSITSTYANSEVDTVRWTRDATCIGAAFTAYYADSVSITTATVRRVINGVRQALQAGDTLTSFTGYEVIGAGAANAVSAVFPLAGATLGSANALAEEYWIIITYVSSKNGVTAPNVRYSINKQYGR